MVLNHTIYHLADFTSGDDTRRLLRIFNALPQRNQNWWILQPLRDPAALPILHYWGTLPAPPATPSMPSITDQQQVLDRLIARLENVKPGNAKVPGACCAATEECLLQQLRQEAASSAALADTQIHSEEEARKWLAGGSAPASSNSLLGRSETLRDCSPQRRLPGNLAVSLRLLAPHRQTFRHLRALISKRGCPIERSAFAFSSRSPLLFTSSF